MEKQTNFKSSYNANSSTSSVENGPSMTFTNDQMMKLMSLSMTCLQAVCRPTWQVYLVL